MRVDNLWKLLKRLCIRRLSAEQLHTAFCQPSMPVRQNTIDTAVMHIGVDAERLALSETATSRGSQANRVLALLKSLDLNSQPQSDSSGSSVPRRDCESLRSMPGIGPGVLSVLLSETGNAIEDLDLKALRCLCGVALVTVSSGKSNRVIRRRASHRDWSSPPITGPEPGGADSTCPAKVSSVSSTRM